MPPFADQPPRELREALAACPGLKLAVLYGSVVTGKCRPDSDLDIGLSGGGFWDQLAIGSEIGRSFQREPHVVDLDAASDWLRYEVARGGRLLFESQRGSWARFQAESALRYFDLVPTIQKCSEGLRRFMARRAEAPGSE
jgi:predicted nucleotidyltransferase